MRMWRGEGVKQKHPGNQVSSPWLGLKRSHREKPGHRKARKGRSQNSGRLTPGCGFPPRQVVPLMTVKSGWDLGTMRAGLAPLRRARRLGASLCAMLGLARASGGVQSAQGRWGTQPTAPAAPAGLSSDLAVGPIWRAEGGRGMRWPRALDAARRGAGRDRGLPKGTVRLWFPAQLEGGLCLDHSGKRAHGGRPLFPPCLIWGLCHLGVGKRNVYMALHLFQIIHQCLRVIVPC